MPRFGTLDMHGTMGNAMVASLKCIPTLTERPLLAGGGRIEGIAIIVFIN